MKAECASAALGGCCVALLDRASPAARADGLAQLKAFHATTKSGKAAFRQSVVGQGTGDARSESTGTFSFQRPGKFRWAYEKPFEQLIVGDGERLWIYDRDLNQVIVRKLDRALGSTPAALLAGDGALEKNFELTDGGRRDGLDFVERSPARRTRDSSACGSASPTTCRARWSSRTRSATSRRSVRRVRAQPALDASQFRFVPPKGADVVGEAK